MEENDGRFVPSWKIIKKPFLYKNYVESLLNNLLQWCRSDLFKSCSNFCQLSHSCRDWHLITEKERRLELLSGICTGQQQTSEFQISKIVRYTGLPFGSSFNEYGTILAEAEGPRDCNVLSRWIISSIWFMQLPFWKLTGKVKSYGFMWLCLEKVFTRNITLQELLLPFWTSKVSEPHNSGLSWSLRTRFICRRKLRVSRFHGSRRSFFKRQHLYAHSMNCKTLAILLPSIESCMF